jgi:23S rRNA (uracil1939-C5)-methyltransferase
VSQSTRIIRIAAKGDGVTEDGRHVAGAAPGDVLREDGTLEHGPHHVSPPCRHFGTCGACLLQHCDEETLAEFVSSRVVNAASGQGLEPQRIAPAHLSPPKSRRRAALHAMRAGGGIAIGFREAGSHRIVDMAECHVLRGEIFALLAPLRTMLARQKGKRLAVDLEMTLADQGVDLGIKGLTVEGLDATEALLDFAQSSGVARLTVDQGYGAEAMWEPEPLTVTLGGVPVSLPPGAFLQATQDGEAVLVAAALEWLAGPGAVADLFSGLGTFAFALAGQGSKVLAAEADQRAHLACKEAAGRVQAQVHSLHRDLFRNPLQPDELGRFEAVVLDPPRAGAREQAAYLAASQVPRVVYISCNPSSWARDAAMLVAGGYRLEELRPVGQFRWSSHVELASLFVKEG